jgi:hypothetical protein
VDIPFYYLCVGHLHILFFSSYRTFIVDAFVACGGNPDKTGHVERNTLVKIIKQDFGLTIDIEDLIDAVDADGSGEIEYEEFKALLTNERH